jgi:hypothetical protein
MKAPFRTILQNPSCCRLAIVAVLILILISCTQNKKVEVSEPEKIVTKFFETYKSDGPKEALGTLLPTNKYISKAGADSVAIKLESLTKDLGDFQGVEKVRERKYGESITLLTYIVKYPQRPLRFNFKFYQPGNGWRIQNFSYETEFIDELDETVKPYRLKENLDTE